MSETQKSPLRPFHESIVDAINRASSAELECLATLIKATKIPKNHDKIIETWEKRCAEMLLGDEKFGVPENIRKQKEETVEVEFLECKGY